MIDGEVGVRWVFCWLLCAGMVVDAEASTGRPDCATARLLAEHLSSPDEPADGALDRAIDGYVASEYAFVGEVIVAEVFDQEADLDAARVRLGPGQDGALGWYGTRHPDVFPGSIAWVLKAWSWPGSEEGAPVPEAVWLREQPPRHRGRTATTPVGWHGIARIPQNQGMQSHHACARREGLLLLHPVFQARLDQAFGHPPTPTPVLRRVLSGGLDGASPSRVEITSHLGEDGANGLLIAMFVVVLAGWVVVVTVWSMTRSSQRPPRRP